MIENRDTLCDHGEIEARQAALDIAEFALERVHPDQTVPKSISRSGSTLRIDDVDYDLDDHADVYVIGAGKGSLQVVRALVNILANFLTGGVVVEKHGQVGDCPGIQVFGAGHPVPDTDGKLAVQHVRDIADQAGKDDLVFACITGGASALLPAPVDGISLDELCETTELMLTSGLPIEEINTVRKHLSTLKGGQLAQQIHPSMLVSLIVIDEVAGYPWGPTVPDGTTVEEAIDVLKRRELWNAVPESVRVHLRSAQASGWDTPDHDDLSPCRTQTVVLADAPDACEAAAAKAAELGYQPMILSTALEGESREVGTVLAGISLETDRHDRPVEPPSVIISGGETTVRVEGEDGRGGPNQELAVSFAKKVRDRSGTVLLSLGTDGTDGPTDVAGGLVDGQTTRHVEEAGLNIQRYLSRHDSTTLLKEVDDAVLTGATGTNVMDLRVLVIEG